MNWSVMIWFRRWKKLIWKALTGSLLSPLLSLRVTKKASCTFFSHFSFSGDLNNSQKEKKGDRKVGMRYFDFWVPFFRCIWLIKCQCWSFVREFFYPFKYVLLWGLLKILFWCHILKIFFFLWENHCFEYVQDFFFLVSTCVQQKCDI